MSKVRHIVVYLEGSFFRDLESAIGVKVDLLRTSRVLGYEISQELKLCDFPDCIVTVEIEKNFNENYILGFSQSEEIVNIITNFWDNWKLRNSTNFVSLGKKIQGGGND